MVHLLASAPYLLSAVLREPPSTYGLMILMPMAAYIAGNAAVARLTMAVGSRRLMILGLGLSLASGALLAAWCLVELSPWAMFVPMAISSIGNGLSQPPAIAAGLSVHPRIAGSVSGLLGFVQMMIAALGTWLIGRLPQQSVSSMLIVVIAALALALIFGLKAVRSLATEGRLASSAPLSRETAEQP